MENSNEVVYYAILDTKAKIGYIEGSIDPDNVMRVIKSRLKKGYYRNRGKLWGIQELYDRTNGEKIEFVNLKKSHKVFAENEVREMGYSVGDVKKLRKDKEKRSNMYVPEEYQGDVRHLLDKLSEGKGFEEEVDENMPEGVVSVNPAIMIERMSERDIEELKRMFLEGSDSTGFKGGKRVGEDSGENQKAREMFPAMQNEVNKYPYEESHREILDEVSRMLEKGIVDKGKMWEYLEQIKIAQ